jgi:hypothetical protein
LSLRGQSGTGRNACAAKGTLFQNIYHPQPGKFRNGNQRGAVTKKIVDYGNKGQYRNRNLWRVTAYVTLHHKAPQDIVFLTLVPVGRQTMFAYH